MLHLSNCANNQIVALKQKKLHIEEMCVFKSEWIEFE